MPPPPQDAEPTTPLPRRGGDYEATQAIDPGHGGPRLADGVELLGEYEGSGFKEPRYLAKRGDGQMVQLTELLHLIAEAIDGSRTHDQIAEEVSERYGRKVTADNVRQLIENSLQRDGIVVGPDGSAPSAPRVDPLLVLKLKTTLLPERGVNFFAALLRPLFWPPVVLAAVAGLVALDVWYFGVHGIAQSMRDLIYRPHLMLLIYGLLILSVFWHELGHATAARYGGARPGHIGFGIYVVWPAFYTDVTDALRLGKGGRVRTDLGGVYFNALFALGTAGVYFLTRFEPLLVLVLIQHLLMLYQFLPFLRLDGYHVVSDLTGIPDLFARIKPTLKSMVPGGDTPQQVDELKPWARIVVTVWVLTVIPVLLYVFGMMVFSAPRLVATGWDSFLVHLDKFRSGMEDGGVAKAAVGGIQMAMVALPMTGMGVTLARVGKRIAVGYVHFTQERPFARFGLGAVGLAAIAAAVYVLIPNGEYKPIQPGEEWTVGESISAATEIGSGRPSLTEGREAELGVTTVRESGEYSTELTDDPATIEEEEEEDETEPPTEAEESPSPEATPTEEAVTPTPTVTP